MKTLDELMQRLETIVMSSALSGSPEYKRQRCRDLIQLYSDQQNKELRENFIGRAYKIIHHLISKHDFDQATIYSVNAFLTEIRDCCKKDNSYIRGIHWDKNDLPVNSDLRKRFNEFRFDPKHHLGMGDIRLTIAQQEEICDLHEAEIQRLTTENKELEEKLMSEQIENGYLQAFRVSNEAEIQRLTKEVEEYRVVNHKLESDLAKANLSQINQQAELTRLRELGKQIYNEIFIKTEEGDRIFPDQIDFGKITDLLKQ